MPHCFKDKRSFQKIEIRRLVMRRFYIAFAFIVLAAVVACAPDGTPKPAASSRPGDTSPYRLGKVRGLVDMHAHPMSYLGFGKKLIHGAVDVGSLIPAGTYKCNPADFRATTIEEVLSNDGSSHGDPNVLNNSNPCGNFVRGKVIRSIQEKYGIPQQTSDGYPDFPLWPRHNDLTHQQMYVDWIRRAWQDGLDIMVALAVNSSTLGRVIEGDGPLDDKASADLQIAEMKSFVSRHNDFMEIAYTPSDIVRIRRLGKLSIVLGVELDQIGNFSKIRSELLTPDVIRKEIRRLFDSGVRYVFPVHLVDNRFGGTAVAKDGAPFLNNKIEFGSFVAVECYNTLFPSRTSQFVTDIPNITDTDYALYLALTGSDFQKPSFPKCAPGIGYANARGLTSDGRAALIEMMRLGMMIDVDHMSERTVNDVLNTISYLKLPILYPVNSGHNGLRGSGSGAENSRTNEQLSNIVASGGLLGLGIEKSKADQLLANLTTNLAITGPRNIALGTDASGYIELPGPRVGSRLTYDLNFPMQTTGTRGWDYNTFGMAHYGMLPDLIRDMRSLPNSQTQVDALYNSANTFVSMWTKSQDSAVSIPRDPTDDVLNPFILKPVEIGKRPEDSSLIFQKFTLGGFCPTNAIGGNRDFNAGPRVILDAELTISPDGSTISVLIRFRAKSNKAELDDTWSKVVYTAPAGFKVSRFLGPSFSTATKVGLGAGPEFGITTGNDTPESIAPYSTSSDPLVSEFRFVGDTGGNDISSDPNNCFGSTRLEKVVFNQTQIALVPN
jgi:microsomal dipeptidase-like Zn-dependent dipeptidase